MTDPVDVNADSPEFREARMPETTLVARLRREAEHDAVEIPDMTREESLSWAAADEIERLTQRLAEVERAKTEIIGALKRTECELGNMLDNKSEFAPEWVEIMEDWNKQVRNALSTNKWDEPRSLESQLLQSGEARKALQELVRLDNLRRELGKIGPRDRMPVWHEQFAYYEKNIVLAWSAALASLDTKP